MNRLLGTSRQVIEQPPVLKVIFCGDDGGGARDSPSSSLRFSVASSVEQKKTLSLALRRKASTACANSVTLVMRACVPSPPYTVCPNFSLNRK